MSRSFTPGLGMALFVAMVLIVACGMTTLSQAQSPAGKGAPPVRPSTAGPTEEIWVNNESGQVNNAGTQDRPVKTLAAAMALLPEPVSRSVTIHLAYGSYSTTGGRDMPENCLELTKRMRPRVVVKLIGESAADGRQPMLAWEGGQAMVDIREGDWWLENLQIGTGSTRQRRGVMVCGPAHATVKNVTFRTCSHSDAGIYAQDGGQVLLRGAIRLNEHLHEKIDGESFCGIIATRHGMIRFEEREKATLDMGNGSLSASYYGCIELGCESARITSWGEQSNTLAINNSGRIDLHNTSVVLRARRKRNTPIGLEDDGHILGEGAHVVIEGANQMAIALQKASTFTCNGIELKGRFDSCLWASSGSMFVGRFLTDVGRVEATTGAGIHIEEIKGKFIGPAVATHCGMISLPDRDIRPAGK